MTAIEDAVAGAVDAVGRAIAARGDRRRLHQGRLAHGRSRPASRCRPSRRTGRASSESGRAAGYRRLDAAETADRIRIEGALGSIYGSQYAVVHPGKLVRGLARAVERQGGTIFERDRRDRRRDRVRCRTSGRRFGRRTGSVRASAVVLAGEAYLSQLRPLHRSAPAALLADRPDRARLRLGLGHDRLARPGGRGVLPAVGRLPVADRRWPDPVRWPRGAVSLRLDDRAGLRPGRPDPRPAPGDGRGLVPEPARDRLRPRLGRSAGHAPRLDPDVLVRSPERRRLRPGLHRPRRIDGQPGRAGPGRPDPGRDRPS